MDSNIDTLDRHKILMIEIKDKILLNKVIRVISYSKILITTN